jgi:hypothetical protein
MRRNCVLFLVSHLITLEAGVLLLVCVIDVALFKGLMIIENYIFDIGCY